MDKDLEVILIDDSGGGCPIGGMLIGAFNLDSGKFLTEEVEVKYFQNPLFKNKGFSTEIANKVIQLIRNISKNNNRLIKICSSTYFNKATSWMQKLNYSIKIGKIGEPLQSMLGKRHCEYKLQEGYPKELIEIYTELEKKNLPEKQFYRLRNKYASRYLSSIVREDLTFLKKFKAMGVNYLYINEEDAPEYIKAVVTMSTKNGNKRRRRRSKWFRQLYDEITVNGQL